MKDEVNYFIVSYYKKNSMFALIQTIKKRYGPIGNLKIFKRFDERIRDVIEGTFNGIFCYNTGGQDGKIRSIIFYKKKEEKD